MSIWCLKEMLAALNLLTYWWIFVPLRKLFLICFHRGDCPNLGCEWQQSSAGWGLLLEVLVYASLGRPSTGASLAGQRWAAAWRTTQLLPAQRCYSPTQLEANTNQWWGVYRLGEPSQPTAFCISLVIHQEREKMIVQYMKLTIKGKKVPFLC